MWRMSNCVFTFFNIVNLSFGFIVVVTALHLFGHGLSECEKLLKIPILVMGIFFFVLSIMGLIGTILQLPVLLWIYSLVVLFWTFALLGLMTFTLVITKDGVGRTTSGVGVVDYGLGDPSKWLHKQVADGSKWNNFRSCVVYSGVCSSLTKYDANLKAEEFYKKKLSPVESGCCKPPMYCGFKYRNATSWIVPKSGPAVPNSDCKTWSNDQNKLCYDCNSCKGGVLADVRVQLRTFAVIIGAQIGITVLMYATSCCTRKNIQRDLKRNRVAL